MTSDSSFPGRFKIFLEIGMVAMLWFMSMSLIRGNLSHLQQINEIKRHKQFSWIAPKLALPNAQGAGTIRLEGLAYHAQFLSLHCSDGMELARHEIKRGPFDIVMMLSPLCAYTIPEIRSDWHCVPGDAIGSRDMRQLSYQLFTIQIDGAPLPLETLASQKQGCYGIETVVNRLTPDEVLALSWDASWYHSIVSQGYSYSEDNSVQQNVAWPFFYPYTAKTIGFIAGLSAPRAMLTVNAISSLLAMLGLFFLGRYAGLSTGPSCIGPAWLAFNPFAIFLFSGFSESMFLLFETLFIAAMVKRWWWPAALTIALLAATRFVGIIAVGPLLIYWAIHHRPKRLAMRIFISPLGFIAIGASGILADIIIKAFATGHPFAAFQIRSAWAVSPLDVTMGLFDVGGLQAGNYLPVLLFGFATLIYIIYILVRSMLAGNEKATILMAPGVSIVLATLILNPEIHSAGRYLLPLAPSIVGVLAFAPLQQRSHAVITILMVIGAAASGLVATNFYQGLPPY